MKRIAIIGGGIAGLSAAHFLEKARRERNDATDLAWTLFEKSDRLGGVIKTENRDGYVLEAGPDSFLTIKPDGAQLCRDLGIGDQLIGSNDAERKTYILVQGRLVPIPEGLEFMVPTRIAPMAATPLFSLGTKLRMAREWFASSTLQNEDESVGDFVRRHFGQQMVERVAEPLLAGVYGGDADRLSVRAVLPRFVEMERAHGSLVRATLKARKQRLNTGAPPQPLFTSLKCGMQQMVDALVASLPAGSLRLRQQEIRLLRTKSGWQVAGEEFDSVLLAVPAPVSASLLLSLQPKIAGLLGVIHYTSSAAVALAYDQADLPPGHGFLVPRAEAPRAEAPRAEGSKILACTFVHKKFAHRAPEGSALLRCFISSSRVPDLLSHSDGTLQKIAQKDLKDILGLSRQPRFAHVFRWETAMPQYETGHLERVAEMEKLLTELPGIQIIGNSFYGIGIPNCIGSARLAVEKITSAAFEPASV
jgi:protoporphyrinogen/coproporphyrinogen III oxidase